MTAVLPFSLANNRVVAACLGRTIHVRTRMVVRLLFAPGKLNLRRRHCWSPLTCTCIMAAKLDVTLLLEAVGAEHYTEKLANIGVVTIEQCAALREERLKECRIPTGRYSVIDGVIRKAKELLSSRDQQELLVSSTTCSLG